MRWFASTLLTHGLPVFRNVIHFVPKEQRGFFESAFWIRDQMPRTLSWDTVAKIRERWGKPFFLKGILNLDDVRRAMDSGVDGIMLGSHGGRQMDWAISARWEEQTSELQSRMRNSYVAFRLKHKHNS